MILTTDFSEFLKSSKHIISVSNCLLNGGGSVLDIKKQLRALEWVYSLAKGSERGIYIPQKPMLEPLDTEGSFE